MKKLKVDISDIMDSYTQRDSLTEMEFYLDTETGKTVMTTSDDRGAVEDFYDESDSDAGDCTIEEFEKWLNEYDCQDWQIDSIRDAFMVEEDSNNRFISIPTQESYEGYDDMVDFAETVENEHLHEKLGIALNGKGAFRRFKDVLYDYPEERARWFKFSEDRVKQRVVDWLESIDIEPEE
ncbi:MAG: UPF0158 family protein [Armatimonadota bacterium]